MEHRVPELVEWATTVMTMNSGDLIACGTNHEGLGFLQDGETFDIEIQHIGKMTVKVRDPLKRTWERGVYMGVDSTNPEAVKRHRPQGGADRDRRGLKQGSNSEFIAADAGEQPLRSHHRSGQRPRAGGGRRADLPQSPDRGDFLPAVQLLGLRCVRSLDGKYCSLVSQGNAPIVAIPVFPSRVARHSSIYIRRDGPVKTPADLKGKRIGIPEWAQTARFIRAADPAPVRHRPHRDPMGPGRRRSAGTDGEGEAQSAEGHQYTPAPDKSSAACWFRARSMPRCRRIRRPAFEQGHPNVARLFKDYLDVEMKYVKDTGIYPIMHTIALKREIVERNPWVAANLFKAFDEARRRSVERALNGTSSVLPLPWAYELAKRMQDVVGKELMPYGVEQNRVTLDAFLQYAFEQGVLPPQADAGRAVPGVGAEEF